MTIHTGQHGHRRTSLGNRKNTSVPGETESHTWLSDQMHCIDLPQPSNETISNEPPKYLCQAAECRPAVIGVEHSRRKNITHRKTNAHSRMRLNPGLHLRITMT